jgi:uncharacterized protein YndB with AHSA1/START domain
VLLQNWGATVGEIAGTVVGDELVPGARLVATRSVDLAAPPEQVFPWLAQLGFGRAGWYSYDWIDNLGRRSATRLHPEWQVRRRGDRVPGGPVSFEATVVDPPRALVLRLDGDGPLGRRIGFSLAYDLRDAPGGGTRLVTRVRCRLDLPGGPVLERWVLGPGDGVMLRRQLLGLRRRVEGPGSSGPAGHRRRSRLIPGRSSR